MEIVKLVVHKRDQAGKGIARRLRRAGQLPAVLYGNGTTLAIALAEKDLVHIRQSEAGENTILDLLSKAIPRRAVRPSCVKCRLTPSAVPCCTRIFIAWI